MDPRPVKTRLIGPKPQDGDASPSEGWARFAESELSRAGYRSSAPRSEVVALIGGQECVRTPAEITDALRSRGQGVGTATVYRTLEALEGLDLVQRLDIGGGPARFEPAFPGREHHHHHLICDRCGLVTPFEDPGLERAIDSLADRLDYEVGGHEVVLRGSCPACAHETENRYQQASAR